MNAEKEPQVVDLAARRKALAARQAAEKKAGQRAERLARSGGSMLGGRKHAGLILAIVVLVLLALYLGPRLF